MVYLSSRVIFGWLEYPSARVSPTGAWTKRSARVSGLHVE